MTLDRTISGPALTLLVVVLAACSERGSRDEQGDYGPVFGSNNPLSVANSGVRTDIDASAFGTPFPSCAEAVAEGVYGLVDDFEDGDGRIVGDDGRQGSWFAYNDGTPGDQSPLTGQFKGSPDDERGSVLHVTGTGFTTWGAGVGFPLHDSKARDTRCLYNAAAYNGISFWAKGNTALLLLFISRDVVPLQNGGSCDEFYGGCWDSHGARFDLTEKWTRYEIPFVELDQEGWGQDVGGLNPSELLAVQFQVAANIDFEFWLDDVRLTGTRALVDAGPQGLPQTEISDAGSDAGGIE